MTQPQPLDGEQGDRLIEHAKAACCCLGMIGNTHYMCMGRGLDLGHCRPGDCDRNCFAQQREWGVR